MIIILMGVSGAGKTMIGRLLAEVLGWTFYDGDDFHPQANVDKMRQGIALTDDDRKPWLRSIQQHIGELILRGELAVVACSALRRSYRDILAGDKEALRFVYLRGGYDLIQERLKDRSGHFFAPDLLGSQFEVLEEPEGVLTVDISQEPSTVVRSIRKGLGL